MTTPAEGGLPEPQSIGSAAEVVRSAEMVIEAAVAAGIEVVQTTTGLRVMSVRVCIEHYTIAGMTGSRTRSSPPTVRMTLDSGEGGGA